MSVVLPFSVTATGAGDSAPTVASSAGSIALIQYYFQFKTDDVQLHLQDQWRIMPNLLLQFGVKASLQKASDEVPIQQKNLAAGNPAADHV